MWKKAQWRQRRVTLNTITYKNILPSKEEKFTGCSIENYNYKHIYTHNKRHTWKIPPKSHILQSSVWFFFHKFSLLYNEVRCLGLLLVIWDQMPLLNGIGTSFCLLFTSATWCSNPLSHCPALILHLCFFYWLQLGKKWAHLIPQCVMWWEIL